MRVKRVLMVLYLLDPVSEELARVVRGAPTQVRQPRGQSLWLRDRLEWILARDWRGISSERDLL